ncbi:hypothetical protein Ciccas_002016 [Cichlidogyrus casuarinus]|uniref:HAP1 N-terminal domain-containing protein n=1 Tax=Cichlidogyrus casuarinus TaxID=1844966 RepID=A0ABD2QIE6_9PLAT
MKCECIADLNLLFMSREYFAKEIIVESEALGCSDIDQILCGLRISQMSQTYEDIEAVTHLLEEKQNDLELAAKIGRKLLDQKQELEKRLGEVEAELKDSTDTIQQLRYQLSLKESILQDVSKDLEYSQNLTHPGPAGNYGLHYDDDDATSISSVGFNSYQYVDLSHRPMQASLCFPMIFSLVSIAIGGSGATPATIASWSLGA